MTAPERTAWLAAGEALVSLGWYGVPVFGCWLVGLVGAELVEGWVWRIRRG